MDFFFFFLNQEGTSFKGAIIKPMGLLNFNVALREVISLWLLWYEAFNILRLQVRFYNVHTSGSEDILNNLITIKG